MITQHNFIDRDEQKEENREEGQQPQQPEPEEELGVDLVEPPSQVDFAPESVFKSKYSFC